jgi:DNA-binding response OmpR family regulator
MKNFETEAPREKTTAAFVPIPASSPARILVVEDDDSIRRLSADVLGRAGYEVHTAEDGEAGWKALNALRHEPDGYDLVITDNNMPKLTGVDMVKKMRSARIDLPVILVTAILPESEIRQHPWMRFSATILKPYSTDELLRTVREVLHASVVGGVRIEEFFPAFAGQAKWPQYPITRPGTSP